MREKTAAGGGPGPLQRRCFGSYQGNGAGARQGAIPAVEDVIRIVLVHDHMLFLDGLREILEREDDIVVAGNAVNGEQAVLAVRHIRPDIVLFDATAGESAPVMVSRMHASSPLSRIIMLNMYDEPRLMHELLDRGRTATWSRA